MTTQTLLVEILVEELPPRSLKKLGEVFADTLFDTLRAAALATAQSAVTAYAAPRRLAARVTHVLAVAADRPVAQKLMPVSVGLDANGEATPALLKKLAALGLAADAVPALRRAPDGKTESLFLDRAVRGATLAEGLQTALEAALAALPVPKVMSYQLADGWRSVRFVRPAHALVALHGADVVPVAALGLNAGRQTEGHRFEARVHPLCLEQADDYAEVLRREGAVIASFAERKSEIARQLAAAARAAGAGLTPIEDEALLDEVAALTEHPNVLTGAFDPEFLAVPQECLILTRKANQKYFPLLDAEGKLTHRFLIVANLSPADPAAIIRGNERVVRPRLADARFFFEQDKKKTLEARLPALDKVVYHNRLGSQGERSRRAQAIAVALARKLGDENLERAAQEAARLAKADLLTGMVGEFPELQGVMGRYYALNDGFSVEVADAIEDHYRPRFSGDDLPRGKTGRIVALADKLETLAGLFGIGQTPTGDKDPFALRRHALGIIRILMESDLDFSLADLLAEADRCLAAVPGFKPAAALLADFIFERLAGALREKGYTAQEVDAVLGLRPQRLRDIPRRLAAARDFLKLPEAQALIAANKRVGNILKKAEGGAAEAADAVDAALLKEAAESALFAALQDIAPRADAAFEAGDHTGSLKTLAALRAPVDAFFDQVMVNVDDAALRANRLALLARLHRAMNRVADLSRLFA
ncbi:MAG: glycine--tRNA ligase subunit beta [Zoogloeaceae bacterium]|jgi:glycyl-tRNA synthetase beta chain|nr:glycine--tRNA ligase subunit beta [Zoogloeaceae bacterium]